MTIDKESLKRLRDLSQRAIDAHVIGYGTANIVISTADLYALEEAIEILSKPTKEKE